MKIKFYGELPLADLQQAIVEQLQQLNSEYLIQHARYATLYLTPTNGSGQEIYGQDSSGRKVEELHCRGPYRSAADDYDDPK